MRSFLTTRTIIDFYDFLSEYQKTIAGNPFGIIKLNTSEDTHLTSPELHMSEALPLVDKYIEKIEHSVYLTSLPENKRQEIIEMLRNLLRWHYPYSIFVHEAKGRSYMIYDGMLNNSKTYFRVFYKKEFDEYFPRELFSRPTPPVGYLSSEEMKKPRVLMLMCDEDTGKDELIQYINRHWKEMSNYLKRDINRKTRDKASKHFLRDVDAYNKYVELKNKSTTVRDTAVEIYMRDVHGEKILDGSIRLLVTKMSRLIEQINTPAHK